jgi:hypothetical protein
LNMRSKGKLIITCVGMNKQVFLVLLLELARVLFDDHVFLIMGMIRYHQHLEYIVRKNNDTAPTQEL